MKLLQIDFENDNLEEKILWLLNSIDGVKAKIISNNNKSNFLNNIALSENDILNNRVTDINDIDQHIQELKNAIKEN